MEEEREGSSGRKGETERDRAAKARSFPQRGWYFARGTVHIKPTRHSAATRQFAVTSRITCIFLSDKQFSHAS